MGFWLSLRRTHHDVDELDLGDVRHKQLVPATFGTICPGLGGGEYRVHEAEGRVDILGALVEGQSGPGGGENRFAATRNGSSNQDFRTLGLSHVALVVVARGRAVTAVAMNPFIVQWALLWLVWTEE